MYLVIFNSHSKQCKTWNKFKKAGHWRELHAQLPHSPTWLDSHYNMGVRGHFASSSPVLKSTSGSWLACTAPGTFRNVLSLSIWGKKLHSILALLSVCSFVPEVRRQSFWLSWLLRSEGGFLTSEMVTLMSACLLGLKGKYKGPWMLSSQEQRMSNKKPSPFFTAAVRILLHLEPLTAVDSSCLGLPGFGEHTQTCIPLACWLINTNGQLSSLHKAAAITGLLEG